MSNEDLWSRVNQVINDIRPFIQQDGGDIALEKIDAENNLTIRFLGACVGCGLLEDYTLETIKSIITDEVPEINEITVIQ